MSHTTRLSKVLLIGLITGFVTLGSAHGELSIQEKDPQASIVNQYDKLKNADTRSTDLHQLVAQLNQKVSVDPNDTLAWELLAQIYYNNSYHAYAVYAASEAIESGSSSAKIKKILLNSSAIVSKSQLEADYLSGETDAAFLAEYQLALSKIYGEVHGFNYDESLPKPPVVRAKARTVAKTSKRAATVKRATAPKVIKAATPKKRTVAKPKPAPVKKSIPKAVPKPKSSSSSNDPFSILRN